ncbi:hypothetical protein HRbin03_00328 [archaeon HR03]|nr:hypothetical protein HRbin03_00328 [archaeon HR03]
MVNHGRVFEHALGVSHHNFVVKHLAYFCEAFNYPPVTHQQQLFFWKNRFEVYLHGASAWDPGSPELVLHLEINCSASTLLDGFQSFM